MQYDCIDDFIQAGWLGAIDAVDKWDSNKGILEHYSRFRIRGAILDYMRLCDFLSRDTRRAVKGSDHVPCNMSIDSHHASCTDRETWDIEDKNAVTVYGSINARQDTLVILRSAGLTYRQRRVLDEYYGKGTGMKDTGKTMHITESRVSQIHLAALEKVRKYLGV
jgi:RNA polymerase sigma factor for flagellar operon FliA